MSLPFIEKYRPKSLDDIVGNSYAIDQFKIIAKQGNMPHMILTGTPGTGKTSSITTLARILLGDYYMEGFLELNASDQRGIDVIRHKITEFCKKKVILPDNIHKIIFLDEMDSMTSAAQQALRRVMEIYTHNTRFAMACNTSTQIIEAIQSRCAVIRFSKINHEDMWKRLMEICKKEGIEVEEGGLKSILLNSDGDMRRGLNVLQSIYLSFGRISEENYKKLIKTPTYEEVGGIINMLNDNKFNELCIKMREIVEEGYSVDDILQLLFRYVRDEDMNDKEIYLNEIGRTQMDIVSGGDSIIQMYGLMARICKQLRK